MPTVISFFRVSGDAAPAVEPFVCLSSGACAALPSPHPLSTAPRRLARRRRAKSLRFIMSPFHHCRFGSVLDGNCPALTEWPALFSCPGGFGWAKSGETPPNQPGKPNKALRKIFVGDRPQGCIVHEASLNCKAFPKLLFEAAPGVRRKAENRSTQMGVFRNLKLCSSGPRLESGGMRKIAPRGWESSETCSPIH